MPSSLCGLFGLKRPNRLSRAHSFPFVSASTTWGLIGRSARDLALAYDAMQGFDEADPAQSKRANELTVSRLKH